MTEFVLTGKKVSIDLKKYTNAGTYTVPVSVELPDGCSLVNNVSVEIILEKTKQNDKTQNENSSSEGQTKEDEKKDRYNQVNKRE